MSRLTWWRISVLCGQSFTLKWATENSVIKVQPNRGEQDAWWSANMSANFRI